MVGIVGDLSFKEIRYDPVRGWYVDTKSGMHYTYYPKTDSYLDEYFRVPPISIIPYLEQLRKNVEKAQRKAKAAGQQEKAKSAA